MGLLHDLRKVKPPGKLKSDLGRRIVAATVRCKIPCVFRDEMKYWVQSARLFLETGQALIKIYAK